MIESIPDLSDAVPAKPQRLTFSGYCAACGTWDDHGLACVCCGYAFDAESQDQDE